MFILRILLLIAILAQAAWLSWNVPWQAHALLSWHSQAEVSTPTGQRPKKSKVDASEAVNDILNRNIPLAAKIGDAPFFNPPGRPDLKIFEGKVSPFIDPKTVDITIAVDRVALYQRFAIMVVSTFFLFGFIGYFLTNRPRPGDVAYSLSLTTGYLAGSVASAIASQMFPDRGPLPWLNLFWAIGVGFAFAITVSSRRRLITS